MSDTVAAEMMTQTVSVHWRAYNRSVARIMSTENQRGTTFRMPISATLVEILRRARSLGCPVGSFQTGIYEVQTDLGIYRRADGMKLCKDPAKGLTAGEQAKAIFKTWDQIEAEEV